MERGRTVHIDDCSPLPRTGRGAGGEGLPTVLLVADYAVRLLVIGAAAALGARWLTAPVRRLVQASDALRRAVAGHGALPSLDERSGTVEVREAARVARRASRFAWRSLLLGGGVTGEAGID